MKLHLPKRLLTALLAAFTAFSLTTGPTAWGEDVGVTESDQKNVTNKNSADNTFVIDYTNNNNAYLWDTMTDIQANVRIVEATLNNGYSPRTYTFYGAISGTGEFSFDNSNVYGQKYIFKGDMSAYSGNMSIVNTRGDQESKFQFDGITTGTGSITVSKNTDGVYFNGATVLNSAVTTTNLTIGVVDGTKTGITTIGRNESTADDGSINTPITTSVSVSNSLTINNGATLKMVNGSLISTGEFTNRGSIVVGSGVSMDLSGGYTQAAGASLSLQNGATLASTGVFTNRGSVVVGSGASMDLSGGYTQTAGASLTSYGDLVLGGTVSLNGAITANGVVSLNENVNFNITGMKMSENNIYTIFNGSTAVDLTSSTIQGHGGWTYTKQSNGTVLATYDGKTVSWAGGDATLEWGTGTAFSSGGSFATYDNVEITGTGNIKLTEALTANKVIIGAAEGTEMSAIFTEDSNTLTVSQGLFIKNGATVEINKQTNTIGFIQGEVTIENGGTLKFNKGDITGYSGGATSMHTINVQAGGELHKSTATNETFAGTLNLNGKLTGVAGSFWDLYGGNAAIYVGDNATASTENIALRLRQDDSVISVGSGSTFTHNGKISKGNEGNGVLVKAGAGTLILAGDNQAWENDIIVSGGTLKALKALKAENAETVAYFGKTYTDAKNRKITLKNGATLDVNGTESYYHVVMENGATITNTGDNVNTGWRALPWIELNGDATIAANSCVVLQKGGSDNSGTFELDLNGHKLTKTGSNELYIQNIKITSGTIQIDSGTLTLASGATIEEGAEFILNAKEGTVKVAAGKILTLSGGTADAPVVHNIKTLQKDGNGDNIQVHLSANSILNKVTTISGVTLTGSGTYNYGSYTDDAAFNPGLGADWKGTVVLKTGAAAIQLTHLAQASNQNSKLQLTGFKGYLDNTDNTMTNNLILKNGDDGYGILLDNGSSDYDANVSFTGSIEGDGHIVYGWKNTTDTGKAGKTATHTFSGDISKWSGMFIRDLSLSGTSGQSMGKNVVVKFTAGGNIFSADGKGGVKEAEDAVDAGKLSVVIDAAEDENGVTPLTNFRGSISGVREVEVKSDTTFQEEVDTDALVVSDGITTTFNADSSIGTLSASSAIIAVGKEAVLTLGGGTETEQKEHTVGSITTATGAGISLGDYATLTLSASLPNGYAGETGNTDAKSSLALNISGGQNTRLNLKLTTDTGWQHNNTVSLSALTEKGKTVDTVYIASGALANTVFGESNDTGYGTHATTNLGGAALSMADQTKLVLRKPKSTGDDFGAGKITLEGTTTLYIYDSAFKLNNDIEGKHLEVTNAGSITFAGSLNLESLTTSQDITFGGGTAQTQKLHSIGTLSATNVTIGEHSTLTLSGDLSASGNVTLSGNATLTLGGGTTETKKAHSANQLTAGGSNANIVVGDYANLTLNGYLDLSNGFTSSGRMTVGVGSTVKATNNIWLNKDYSILLKDTAKLKFGDSVTMTGRQGDESLITTSAYKDADGKGHNRDMYSADRETYTLSHVDVEVSAEGNTTMGNKLEASALTHAGSGTLTVSNSGNTITSLAAEGGNVKLSASMGVDSISAKTGKIVTVTNGNTISMAGGVSLRTNGAEATLTAQTDTALLQLQEDASFSIKDMALSNVAISAANAETKVNLTNVTATNVQLAQGSFTMTDKIALDGAVGTYSVEGSTASFTTGQLNGITLNNANDAASLTVDLGELPDCLQDGKTYNITIALSGFSMAAYDGTGLLFAADSWLGKLLADQGASQYVSSGDVETATTLAANNNTVTVKYAAMTGGNVGTIITITGLTIPEPTTSTLGLVALAALVTRRRRK